MLYELLKNTFYLLFTHHQPLYCESIASSAIAFSQRGLETHLLSERTCTIMNIEHFAILGESIFYEPGCNSPHLQDSFHLNT